VPLGQPALARALVHDVPAPNHEGLVFHRVMMQDGHQPTPQRVST